MDIVFFFIHQYYFGFIFCKVFSTDFLPFFGTEFLLFIRQFVAGNKMLFATHLMQSLYLITTIYYSLIT